MLSSVIQRAGGFTDEAFVNGSVFLRESLREREQVEIDRLLDLLNDEIAVNQLRDSNSDIALMSKRLQRRKGQLRPWLIQLPPVVWWSPWQILWPTEPKMLS